MKKFLNVVFFGNPSNWIWNLICCFYWCMSADGVIKMRASFCVKLGRKLPEVLFLEVRCCRRRNIMFYWGGIYMGDIMWNPLERSLHLIRVLLYWGLSFDISNICESISSLIQGIAYQDFYVLCLIPTNVTQGM